MYAALRGSADDPVLATLIPRAAERYVATSITAWEFARGKLRGDPVYRQVISAGWLPSGGTLVDVGCGQGLMLALLAEGRCLARSGRRPAGFSPPVFDRLVGIERRARVAHLARQALGSDADIVEQDARMLSAGSCRAVLFFDVLHMMPADDQEALLTAMASALEPGGVILVRDADASAGWRFGAVRTVNRLKAIASGAWRQPFYFRSNADWLSCFRRLGFDADARPMADGTPFANVLFRLTVRRQFS